MKNRSLSVDHHLNPHRNTRNYPLTGFLPFLARFPAFLPGLAALFVFFFMVFFASCTLSLNPVNSIFRASVKSFNLDNFVPAPQPDNSPRLFLDPGYYTISFRWFDVTDPAALKELQPPAKFGPGRLYRAELTIRSNSGFTFEDPPNDAKKFTWGTETNSPNKGRGGIISAEHEGTDTIKITIDFAKTGKTKINLLNLYGIKAPENDGTPTRLDSLVPRTGYKITEINWFDVDNGNTAFDGKFKVNGNYTAKVTLKADLKYTFEGLEESDIIHAGQDVNLDPKIPPEGCNAVTVTIVFFPAGITGISHIDLGDIPGPVAGDNADITYSTPEGAGYDVTAVDWSKDGVTFDLKPPFKFEIGQKYWSRITVTPHDGYQFANLNNLENRVTHNGENVTIVPADDGKGSIYIIIEYDEVTALVTVVNLKGIPAPRTGETPVTEMDTKGLPFTVKSITWQPDDAVFQARAYKAVVELETKAGYFFDDLKTSGISHNGIWAEMKPETLGAGTTSITVTINFEASGSGSGSGSGNESGNENGSGNGNESGTGTNQDGDRDNDELTDEEEAFYGTDPDDPDTDGDGFPDGWEVTNAADGADPLDPTKPGRDGDADQDGFPNGWEMDNGHDPFDNTDPDPNGDEDGDGFPNGWEANNGYDPLDNTDPAPNGDDDNDGFTNQEEYENGTNPHLSSGKTITSFAMAGVSGSINQTSGAITLTLPAGTDRTNLTPVISLSPKATVNPSAAKWDNTGWTGSGIDPWVRSKTYTVTAEDGFTKTYTVTVTVPKSNAKDILSFIISPTYSGNIGTNTVSVGVPNNISWGNLTPTITVSPGASISPASGVARSFSSPQTYTVTAENGTTKQYTVTVTQAEPQIGPNEPFNVRLYIVPASGGPEPYWNYNLWVGPKEIKNARSVQLHYTFTNAGISGYPASGTDIKSYLSPFPDPNTGGGYRSITITVSQAGCKSVTRTIGVNYYNSD